MSLVCNWSWIDDTSLVFFNIFIWITWNFNLSNNLITNLNSLVNLESVWWNFLLNNNQIVNADALATRSSNNFRNINLSNNNLITIEGIRNLNNLSDLNTISSINRTLQLSNRNYSWKIQSTSPICNNLTILSHNWNIFSVISLICN